MKNKYIILEGELYDQMFPIAVFDKKEDALDALITCGYKYHKYGIYIKHETENIVFWSTIKKIKYNQL